MSDPVPASSGGRVGAGAEPGGEARQHLLHPLGVGARRLRRHGARRSLAAATICMALVIFCVALTEEMRFRRSLSEGMVYPSRRRSRRGAPGAGVALLRDRVKRSS